MSENIPITKDETEIANDEARYIFGYLRKKYCNDSTSDLDIVLNSLCFALLRLIKLSVAPDDHEAMVKIITDILMKEVKRKG
jgi:hypothetical protein